jgi:hypothetical protein
MPFEWATTKKIDDVRAKGIDRRKSLEDCIITDLHGNCEALRCLPEAYDELWVLGDLVNYGPEPSCSR